VIKIEKIKELLVCPKCGNSKNEIYAEMKGLKIIKIFVRCPNCGKESLVAHTI
jgi:uncharacterized Zn finger protein